MSHSVAVSAFIICSGLCACTDMLYNIMILKELVELRLNN